jgi:hypothetical protein
LFSKRTDFGKTAARIWFDNDENVIFSSNSIVIDIVKMNDLFEADELKERGVDRFLQSKFVHQLNVNVKE